MARLNRSWVRRAENAASAEMVSIPQADGTVARFPEARLQDAYLNALHRSLGRDVEEHPILAAIRNASDPQWANMWSDLLEDDPDEEPVEDLSE